MRSPTEDHWKTVIRILRYLKGTIEHDLLFCPCLQPQLHAYPEAEWLSNPDDCHSQYEFAIYFGSN